MDTLPSLCLSIITYLTLTGGSAASGDETLDFAKRVFHDLGENYGNVTQTAIQNQAEFDAMAADTGGVLYGLFEMRVMDLQTTLEHTLAMQQVVGLLMANQANLPQ